jgi:hypothetical protein
MSVAIDCGCSEVNKQRGQGGQEPSFNMHRKFAVLLSLRSAFRSSDDYIKQTGEKIENEHLHCQCRRRKHRATCSGIEKLFYERATSHVDQKETQREGKNRKFLRLIENIFRRGEQKERESNKNRIARM